MIHVESPNAKRFSLGQFFAVWGVRLGSNQLGGVHAPVTVYINGKRATTAPGQVDLLSHEEIAVVVGRAPTHVPNHYSFPAGE